MWIAQIRDAELSVRMQSKSLGFIYLSRHMLQDWTTVR